MDASLCTANASSMTSSTSVTSRPPQGKYPDGIPMYIYSFTKAPNTATNEQVSINVPQKLLDHEGMQSTLHRFDLGIRMNPSPVTLHGAI